MAKKETEKKAAPTKRELSAPPKKVAAPRKKAAAKKTVSNYDEQIKRSIENSKRLGFVNPFTTLTKEQIEEAKKKVELGKYNNDLRNS